MWQDIKMKIGMVVSVEVANMVLVYVYLDLDLLSFYSTIYVCYSHHYLFDSIGYHLLSIIWLFPF
jgi:hypothetical protein